MTALAADGVRFYADTRHTKAYPVLSATAIWDGSALCILAAGFARPVAASLSSPEFIGFARESVPATTGNGAVTVNVIEEGFLSRVAAITSATGIGNVGDTVYMSDDGSGFTLASTNNVSIGKIHSYDATNGFTIFFQSVTRRSI